MDLTENEKEFLKVVTEQHLKEVKEVHVVPEPLIEYVSEETYVEFLEGIIEKLK